MRRKMNPVMWCVVCGFNAMKEKRKSTSMAMKPVTSYAFNLMRSEASSCEIDAVTVDVGGVLIACQEHEGRCHCGGLCRSLHRPLLAEVCKRRLTFEWLLNKSRPNCKQRWKCKTQRTMKTNDTTKRNNEMQNANMKQQKNRQKHNVQWKGMKRTNQNKTRTTE